jgi:hypothetical protein
MDPHEKPVTEAMNDLGGLLQTKGYRAVDLLHAVQVIIDDDLHEQIFEPGTTDTALEYNATVLIYLLKETVTRARHVDEIRFGDDEPKEG